MLRLMIKLLNVDGVKKNTVVFSGQPVECRSEFLMKMTFRLIERTITKRKLRDVSLRVLHV